MVESLSVPVAGARLLDAACGTGRRLLGAKAQLAIGIDLTPEMIPNTPRDEHYAAADVRALPFRAAEFDVVWCRLALGHVPQLAAPYRELSRVCRLSGHVVVTDFHAAAVAAGHRRTFRDGAGEVHEIEHYVHNRDSHERAAREAGLSVREATEGLVGPSVRDFYERAGRTSKYEAQLGLPLVLGLVFFKDP